MCLSNIWAYGSKSGGENLPRSISTSEIVMEIGIVGDLGFNKCHQSERVS